MEADTVIDFFEKHMFEYIECFGLPIMLMFKGKPNDCEFSLIVGSLESLAYTHKASSPDCAIVFIEANHAELPPDSPWVNVPPSEIPKEDFRRTIARIAMIPSGYRVDVLKENSEWHTVDKYSVKSAHEKPFDLVTLLTRYVKEGKLPWSEY